MKKKFLAPLLLGMLAFSPVMRGADYGLPSEIQDGNILHCFNWTAAQIKAELPNIAAAGYGSVQMSPLQRPDAKIGESWHALYRPYDLAFKSSSFCSEEDLKSLCAEAATYGIKVIVDVVANHVDKTAGYHDTWWDSNGRVRWEGSCQYNNRYSITHGQLGDYGDINSESAEVQARAKAYVEKLKSLGVKGIRWDAAKHIALPSEGCNFWSTVTSVPGMYHYGEILNDDGTPINEYAKYMSVTDNRYSNSAAQNNGGIQQGYGGAWAVDRGVASNKLVYWGESHDTYSNDEWSQNVDQSVIDRAYACVATRNGATALYLARPNTKGFNNIKLGKGTDAYKSAAITAVNKLRNAAGSAADYCTTSGNTFSCTRQGIGAVVVTRGSGNVSIANGGSYCPAGSYKDLVSGSTFTVTASTISGNVGSSGIAVIIKDGVTPTPNPDPNPNPDPTPGPTGSMWILGNLPGAAGWSTTPGTGVAMTQSGSTYTASNVEFVAAANETSCYFNLTDYVGATWDDLNMTANRYGAATEGVAVTLGTAMPVTKYANNVDASGCLSWTIPAGKYDVVFDASAMTLKVTNAGSNPNPDPTPGPTPTPGTYTIYFDNSNSNWSTVYCYTWTTGDSDRNAAWPGVAMTKVKDNIYSYTATTEPKNVIFTKGDDSGKTEDLTWVTGHVFKADGSHSQYEGGDNPNPDPVPTPGDNVVYFDNSSSNWPAVYCYTWTTGDSDRNAAWPGVAMTKVKDNIYSYTAATAPKNVIFSNGSGTQTDDLSWVNGHIYKADGSHSEYQGGGDNTKPVVTANPASGRTFTSEITVTLTVSPAAKIYYTINGSTPTTSSTVYSSPLTFTETTTLRTLAVTTAGAQNEQSFTYTKSNNPNPNPVISGDNLITDYYKVNPNGQVGSNKTMNMSFNGMKSTTAFSNWTEAELIAQGVARDVAQAMKGKHERPIIDSYAIYAAYDNTNLYLGVQLVYTVWDQYGEGKQPGESKPYNMDGRLMWAFDLDPNASFDGYINGTKAIWNDEGAPGAKFENGVDAVWIGSSKPGVGTPGFFVPTPDGHASYDAAYCKSISGTYYGYADGVLPSIVEIWGQKDFEYDPEALKGNDGFVDLRGEIEESAHTFYEWKLPLSVLGVTADYIRNNGIGVQFLDVYGASPVGGTPYDPSFFDNVKDSYSMDSSSSKEKEDEDVIKFAPARVGKLQSGVESVGVDNGAAFRVVTAAGELTVIGVADNNVVIAGVDGKVYFAGVASADSLTVNLGSGLYIVKVGDKAMKVVVK